MNECEYQAAVEELDEILRTNDMGSPRLDILADLIEAYEDVHYPIRDMSDAEAEEILGINGGQQ